MTVTGRTVSVAAPATLDAGYTFDATIDGRTFTVTVPDGGVKEGETFQVPHPDDAEPVATVQAASVTPVATPNNATVPSGSPDKNSTDVTGRWRSDLCDCGETCCCPFWMGWCCGGILLGQIMQRFKLDPLGRTGHDYKNTCVILSILTILFFLLVGVLAGTSPVITILGYCLVIYFIAMLTLTRLQFRRRYNIPGSCCGESCMDDCCCAYWCGCCVLLQLHTHTHDKCQYPYEITSSTGLANNVPDVV